MAITLAPDQLPTLSNEEVLRYSRHLIMPEVGMDGQRKLKEASVLCVGAGGLGSPLALYLAAAGVGHIGLVEFDVVDESNLQRQIIHGTEKVEATGDANVVEGETTTPEGTIVLPKSDLEIVRQNQPGARRHRSQPHPQAHYLVPRPVFVQLPPAKAARCRCSALLAASACCV